MPGLVNGKVAVVTGGASGAGRAIARLLAEQGAAGVVIADVRPDPREGGAPTHELVRQLGCPSVFVRTDVTRREDLRDTIDAAVAFGGVDVMINNAGIFRRQDFLTVTEQDFDRMMSVNVRGVFFGCQIAALAMRDRGGSVVNMCSVASYRGSAGHASYHASKGAVQSMTYALARELAPLSIRVNAVHPGVVDTTMMRVDEPVLGQLDPATAFPMGRPAMPVDVAQAVLFLASDLSAYISGASLTVDGAAGSRG